MSWTEIRIKKYFQVKRYCEEVDSVYQIIDPGYQKERGTMLRALCEVAKILAKKYLNEGKETEEVYVCPSEEGSERCLQVSRCR